MPELGSDRMDLAEPSARGTVPLLSFDACGPGQ
ncbi:hypothetical protein H4W79_004471 [Nocardiopsis terrae]|uniref:Uncharacterized protein n=1 Tax=Nocardiopsis terrae TaxID=372655 RepID=A0ABR9HMI5_9ACTN|nr:hypothetical protein [Nocardiopsis terrae]